MKLSKIGIIALSLTLLMSCYNENKQKRPSLNQKRQKNKNIQTQKKDTITENIQELPFNIDSVTVILDNKDNKKRNIVFVDNTNDPEYFNDISNFDMPSKFEISMYRKSYQTNIKHKQDSVSIELTEIIEFADKWIPVVVYNNQYYYYHPAKLEYNKRRMITDSCIAVYDNHGVSAEVIKNVSKLNQKHYSIDVYAIDENEQVVNKEINIYIIDTDNKIAIWEEMTSDNIHYDLMIAKSEEPLFPVIVNFGQHSSPEEYVFEEINYFKEIENILSL